MREQSLGRTSSQKGHPISFAYSVHYKGVARSSPQEEGKVFTKGVNIRKQGITGGLFRSCLPPYLSVLRIESGIP